MRWVMHVTPKSNLKDKISRIEASRPPNPKTDADTEHQTKKKTDGDGRDAAYPASLINFVVNGAVLT